MFLIGELGSGKTALINYILNEMYLNKDNTDKTRNIHLEINGSIAHVSQNTWLRSETIKVFIYIDILLVYIFMHIG